jgi:hypothetical protein
MVGEEAMILGSCFEGWILERPASGGVKVLDGSEKSGGACAVHAHDYGVKERRTFFSTSGEQCVRRTEGRNNAGLLG